VDVERVLLVNMLPLVRPVALLVELVRILHKAHILVYYVLLENIKTNKVNLRVQDVPLVGM
jgi:hypothetical protein